MQRSVGRVLAALSLALGLLLAGGCATVKGIGEDVRSLTDSRTTTSRVPMEAAHRANSTAHVDCETQQQQGCWEIRVLSFKWEASNPVLEGLDRPSANQAERRDRAHNLGPRLWEAYRAGKVRAALPRSYTVCLFAVTDVSSGNLSAYRVNGMASAKYGHVVTKTSVEEVSPGVCANVDPIFGLGTAEKAYRIRTSGADAIGASLQVPWSMMTDKTYILICPEEDGGKVYPAAKLGLWVTPTDVGWLKAKGSKRMLVPSIAAK